MEPKPKHIYLYITYPSYGIHTKIFILYCFMDMSYAYSTYVRCTIVMCAIDCVTMCKSESFLLLFYFSHALRRKYVRWNSVATNGNQI